MATSPEYIAFVADSIPDIGTVRYRKMFGEYMVYVDDKPILLVCDSTVYVKKLDAIAHCMHDAEVGCPYEGAKEHYILDIEDADLVRDVVTILVSVTPVPKPRKRRA